MIIFKHTTWSQSCIKLINILFIIKFNRGPKKLRVSISVAIMVKISVFRQPILIFLFPSPFLCPNFAEVYTVFRHEDRYFSILNKTGTPHIKRINKIKQWIVLQSFSKKGRNQSNSGMKYVFQACCLLVISNSVVVTRW